jgi:4-hydroxybenzoate polyprenyltransferase
MQETQEVMKQPEQLLLFKILRPRQWTKNLIAFAPLLFAGRLGDMEALLPTALCIQHPVKKRRPIAAGLVSQKSATVVAALALIIGLAGGFLVRPVVGLGLILYVILQVVYNYKLKGVAILDVFSIAAGFVLRAACGGAAAHVTLSGWFLICTSLGALFLAIEKRRQELLTLGDDAITHRKSFEKYSLALIDRMEAVVVPSLVTSYCIYCFFSPSSQWMLLTAPVVLFGVLRYQLLSTLKSSTGAPEEVLLCDRSIQICIAIWVAISIGVVHGWIPDAVMAVVNGADALSVFSK